MRHSHFFRQKLTCFNSSTSSPAVLYRTIGIVSVSEEWYVFSKTKSMTIFKRRILTSSFEYEKSLFIQNGLIDFNDCCVAIRMSFGKLRQDFREFYEFRR